MEKKLLSDHLRLVLCEKYGNLASATRTLDINYDRAKQSLQKNKFPRDILSAFLVACDMAEDREQLEQRFTFSTTARFFTKKVSPGLPTAESLISAEDMRLLASNELVRGRVVELIRRECEWARTLLTP